MQSDVLIVGGGIAGLTATLELLDAGKHVTLLDRDAPERLGGTAQWSMGGFFFTDSPIQRKAGIRDSPELALRDWHARAQFGPQDIWPMRWAEAFVHNNRKEVFEWLRGHGLAFVGSVQWIERGLYRGGNSVPRFHICWGSGRGLMDLFREKLDRHPQRSRLRCHFYHKVERLIGNETGVTGVGGINERTGEPFEFTADHTIVAAGGVSANDALMRKHWHPDWASAPPTILNGGHCFADGTLHRAAGAIGANVTHLDKMWNYAAGLPYRGDDAPYNGISLVPPKSAIWVNSRGERIGPMPLVSGYDTRKLVRAIAHQPGGYSWQILNRKIADKELGVSGSAYNDALREKRKLALYRRVLFGNPSLVDRLIEETDSIVVADSLPELVEKMNALTGENAVTENRLRAAIEPYDAEIARGPRYFNDEQLRRIAHLRRYLGDRLRTAKFQSILDPKAGPLLAIREFILARKTLGGIQTDLQGKALKEDAEGVFRPIAGLYAIGEAAGFGGGGVHGIGALEGTFLGGCVFTARRAARAILGKG